MTTQTNETNEKKEKDVKLALEDVWADEEQRDEDETAGGDSAPSYEELKKVAAQADEMREAAQRMKAEFDNFRKRTRQEKENWTYQALEPLLADMIGVVDDFERALDAARNADEVNSVVQGVEMISGRLTRVLAEHGLERVSAVGEVFDPERHEAVVRQESADAEPGTILDELQPGYQFKEKILRHPKVAVAVEAKA